MLNDLLPKTLAFYTKWTYTTQAHFYSNFSLIIVDVDSLNFVHFSQKNISWYVPRTATQHEIPLMNFEKGFPETIAQHVIWNLIVVQIKGEFKFIELGHAKDTQRCCSRYSLWREWYTPWHKFTQKLTILIQHTLNKLEFYCFEKKGTRPDLNTPAFFILF